MAHIPPPPAVYPVVYLNGQFVPSERAVISAFDRGFLLADGVFETLYVVRGRAIQLERHLARLARSAAYVRLTPPPTDALATMIEELLARNRLADRDAGAEAAVRLTISRGVAIGGPPTVVAFVRELTEGHLRKRVDGVLGFVLPYSRASSGEDLTHHKTLAYLASSLGQIVLAEMTPDPTAEGFFVDGQGDLLEGTSSNLFVVEGATLVTPAVAQGVLPGTSRAVVLELAGRCGLATREEPISQARLRGADEAFITSSTLRVAPLVSLDGDVVGGGRRGPVVARLQQAFQAHIEAELAT